MKKILMFTIFLVLVVGCRMTLPGVHLFEDSSYTVTNSFTVKTSDAGLEGNNTASVNANILTESGAIDLSGNNKIKGAENIETTGQTVIIQDGKTSDAHGVLIATYGIDDAGKPIISTKTSYKTTTFGFWAAVIRLFKGETDNSVPPNVFEE